jgi:hypothetical protein
MESLTSLFIGAPLGGITAVLAYFGWRREMANCHCNTRRSTRSSCQ